MYLENSVPLNALAVSRGMEQGKRELLRGYGVGDGKEGRKGRSREEEGRTGGRSLQCNWKTIDATGNEELFTISWLTFDLLFLKSDQFLVRTVPTCG